MFLEVNTANGLGAWNAVFYALIFKTGTIAAILVRRWHWKQDEILNISPTGRAPLHPPATPCLTRRAPHIDPWTLARLAGHRDMNVTKLYVHRQKQTISGDG